MFDAPRRGLPPRHLADLDVAGRREAVVAVGEKAFRAEQLSRHYFAGHVPAQMTDLAAPVRAKLTADLLPPLLTPLRELETDQGDTVKTLWKGHDGTLVESVLMRYADRTTVCVSSQAGCGMACPFCATGQAGLTRNLSTGENVEQVVAAQRTESARGGRVSNVVFMGRSETPVSSNAPALTCSFVRPEAVFGPKCDSDGARRTRVEALGCRGRRAWRSRKPPNVVASTTTRRTCV